MNLPSRLALAALLFLSAQGAARANPPAAGRVGRGLHGTLIDHTRNHGADRRIWSATLGERRDLYVYLPPGYDPTARYPVLLWLHGIFQDEQTFPPDGMHTLDAAMASGRMPPTIVVIPDGTRFGRPRLVGPRPLFLDSNLGPYEEYVVRDVWAFVQEHYPVRPEREAHVVGGFSGGGAAAVRIAIRHRDLFGAAFAISAPLNPRWLDCRGRYFGNFDPNCWGWRTDFDRGREVVGRFYLGLVAVRVRPLVYPLYGRGPDALAGVSRDNPIEMLDQYDVRPGDLPLFVAYGGRDEFNTDAQTESFLYRAAERGLDVAVGYDPRGRHSLEDAQKFLPQIADWTARLLAPYDPRPACPFLSPPGPAQ